VARGKYWRRVERGRDNEYTGMLKEIGGVDDDETRI